MGTCQLKDKNYNGNCEQCTSREYCMLSEIMERVKTLEESLAQLKAKPIS